MMDSVVLKFGGSSVADNIRLNIVADKIIEFKQKSKNVVVVVSAQGKTTDKLIKEAQELSAIPEERELDMLLSTGEQITSSKLGILLNRKGYPAVSLTGWQAGIQTNNIHNSAKIEAICPDRIIKELEKNKVVIVTGFQGIDEEQNITTLGRGGSDTTAVAIQSAINAERCYIFSDVDGIYSADPNIVKLAKKLNEISFQEMQEISDSGAKVLHNRCIQIGQKFDCNITAKSTFLEDGGTNMCKKIENSEIKSIVKNDKLELIHIKKSEKIEKNEVFNIYQELLKNNIIIENFKVDNNEIKFRIQKSERNKVEELLENKYPTYDVFQSEIVKLAVIGYGIIQDNIILNKIINILEKNEIELFDINLTQAKIEIILDKLSDDIVKELHQYLIEG